MVAIARIGDRMPRSLFDTAAWKMLQRGNVAPVSDTTALLGHAPRSAVPRTSADLHCKAAMLTWLLPLLRLSLAVMWIVTGIVSLGIYPVDDSLDLLARAGVPRPLQSAMLYGAARLDLFLGVATLVPMRQRRWLWIIQSALVVFYTAVITIRLPEFWAHPYGQVLKNIPILALLWLLAMLEPRKPTQ